MDFAKLRQISEDRARKAVDEKRHDELLSALSPLTGRTEVDLIGADKLEIAAEALLAVAEAIYTNKQDNTQEAPEISTEALEKIVDEALKKITEAVKPSGVEQPDYTEKFDELKEAIDSKKLTVKAPIVNVPETVVNVEAPDLTKIDKGLEDVVGAVKANNKDVQEVSQVNTLIDEKFDEYKISYKDDPFTDGEDQVGSIDYYFKKKKVATLKLSYKGGKLTGVTKK